MNEYHKEIKMLEFRVLQLELALGSLMQVVAFPEKHKDFRDRMEDAVEIAEKEGVEVLELMSNGGAEA
jgi:hypothetical protein|tara:strand:- start:228 stop:431 length:204 start_codon:yes stop_codon:yes gene_type:complete